MGVFADFDLTGRGRDFVIYVLAVVGGFVAGYVFSMIVCRLLGKYAIKRRIPGPIERAFRVIGGMLLAALVAYLLFKGWGFGGTGTGEGKESGGPTSGKENVGKEKQPPSKSTTSGEAAIPTQIVITIQPAKDAPRTFRFEGDAEAVNLADAIKRLDSLRSSTANKLPDLLIRVYDNSSATNTSDVAAFRARADELGFQSRFEKVGKRLE